MRRPMSFEHRIKMQKNYVHLVNEMQVEYMLPYFIQEGVITFDIMDHIRSAKTSFGKNDRFLKILPHRGDKAYSTLLASLKYGSGQLHLVDLLENVRVSQQEIEELKREVQMSGLGRGLGYGSAHLYSDEVDSANESRRTSTCTDSANPSITCPPSPQKPIQNKTVKKRKVKKKRHSNHKGHTEQLPEVSHLFPHIVTHIHKKWRQMATALGLEDADFDHIVEIPHEKQSRYAQMVLETWQNKFKHKATKARLIQALETICVRKAINAISIYTVPTFKAKPCGARKTNSVNSVADDVHIDVKPKKSLLDFYTTGSKQTLSAKLATKLPHRKRTKGMLPIRCQVEKISSSGSTHDQTQQAFLSLADKITDSMVEQGEEATKILNVMERLQGIVFHEVYKGSIILETKVQTLLALETLMRLYASQDLALIFEQVFVTPDILAQHNALQVKLRVEILQSDYEECRDHLEQQMRCESIESDSAISSYTTQSSDVSDSDDEVFADNDLLVDDCQQLVRDAIIDLQMTLSQFNPDISEFLMTLQLIHPPNITKISTISDLEVFKEFLVSSGNQSLSASTITKYLQILSHFADKIFELKDAVSSIAAESTCMRIMADYQPTISDRKIQAIDSDLVAVQRCLSKTYNFSSHIHSRTVQLTTLETLSYRGLLSYPYVIIDMLYKIIQPSTSL